MATFHSRRERWLWLATGLLVLAIYVTLPLMRRATDAVREAGWLRVLVIVALLAGAASLALWIARQRPGWRQLLWLLPIAAAYAVALSLAVTPEERLHLVEYGAVGVLAYASLSERRAAWLRAGIGSGRLTRWPEVSAVLLTAAAGWLDEGIQHLLPTRYYDLRDVAFNAVAGLLAVATIAVCRSPEQR